MPLQPSRIVRPHIAPVASYTLGASASAGPGAIRLDLNESPFPLSPRAQTAFDGFRHGNRYPEITQGPLIRALAAYLGAPSARVVAGAGLDDVFATLAITIINPGDEVIIAEPTFGVYRTLFTLHGATIVNVPLGAAPGFALDVDGILAARSPRTKLVIVCNPNNPTGTIFAREDIRRIIEATDALVAIDEAYAEFSGVSHLDLALEYDNVAIFRTLSKFAGLAGYRVGYGVFPDALMPWLRVAQPPFLNISALAADIAIASLTDLDVLQGNVAYLNAQRDRLGEDLNALVGVTAYQSGANFLLVSLPVDDSGAIVAALADRRIYVRHFPNPDLGLRHCIRVSVSDEADNAAFLNALTDVLAAKRAPMHTASRTGA